MNIDNHFQTANIDHENKEVQFELMNRPICYVFEKEKIHLTSITVWELLQSFICLSQFLVPTSLNKYVSCAGLFIENSDHIIISMLIVGSGDSCLNIVHFVRRFASRLEYLNSARNSSFIFKTLHLKSAAEMSRETENVRRDVRWRNSRFFPFGSNQ